MTISSYPLEDVWHLFNMTRLYQKTKVQSKIPVSLLVEQKTGILAVLATPLLEPPIQKTLKKAKKSEQKMFHVKHFLLQHFTLCQQEKIIGGPITQLSVMTHKAYGVAIRPPIKG